MISNGGSNRRAALWAIGIAALTTVVLAFMGRHFWCQEGDFAIATWDTASAHLSQHLLDPYSFTHVEHGLLFFALFALVLPRQPIGFRFVAAIALAGAWEVLENSSFIIDRYREQTIDAGYYGDSIANSLADMVCCAVGFVFAARVRWFWSVGLLLAFELGLALTIRDGLLLNIVMLVHSFDFILDWQARR